MQMITTSVTRSKTRDLLEVKIKASGKEIGKEPDIHSIPASSRLNVMVDLLLFPSDGWNGWDNFWRKISGRHKSSGTI